jgi:hypothetical protein
LEIGDLVRVSFDKPTEPLSSWYQKMYRNQDPAVVIQIDNLPHGQTLVYIFYEGHQRCVMSEHIEIVGKTRL